MFQYLCKSKFKAPEIHYAFLWFLGVDFHPKNASPMSWHSLRSIVGVFGIDNPLVIQHMEDQHF